MDSQHVLQSFRGSPGAYLHVPFCQRICPFCPYNKVLDDEHLASRYFHALDREVARYADALTVPFSSLYIGGGTPTLHLDALAPIIRRIPVSGERAIEVLPTHATPPTVEKLHALGITYLSLGVQSFDGRMLRHLRRPTTAKANYRALEAVRGQFDCVDVDLIFDVAFDAEAIFLRDLETCFEAKVQQVSTYPLMRFGYTPFGKAHHARNLEHATLRKAEGIAARHGYARRSVWTFHRGDTPVYTSITRPYYIGFGAGSASYTGQYFLVNHFGLEQYIAAVESGTLPIARTLALAGPFASAYSVFWSAYAGEVAPSSQAVFGRFCPAAWGALFSAFSRLGWVERDGETFKLTPIGRDHYHDLERWVTYHFIEPLWAEMMREHTQTAARGTSWLRLPEATERRNALWHVTEHLLERRDRAARHTAR